MRSISLIATLVTLTACPGPVTLPPDAGPYDSGEPDAGPPDAGLDCRSAGVGADAPCGTLQWTASTVMSRPRNHQSSGIAELEAGAFLYVAGGVNGSTLFGFVDRAKLNDDGSLGAFEQLPQQLLYPEAGATGQIMHGTLLLAGGTVAGNNVTALTQFAQLHGDGSLGQFFPAGEMKRARMHPSSVTRGDFVYVMGGFDEPNLWDDVEKIQWYPNETFAQWEAGGTLPGKRSHMAVTQVGDFVFLTGGMEASSFTNPPCLKAVSRGTFDANGNLGGWVEQTAMPVGLCTHASAFWGGSLYVMGGIDTTVPQLEKRVWRAPIGADHSLGAWVEAAALPEARGHVHDLPIFRNHLYSISGAIDFSHGSTAAIQIGTFQPE